MNPAPAWTNYRGTPPVPGCGDAMDPPDTPCTTRYGRYDEVIQRELGDVLETEPHVTWKEGLTIVPIPSAEITETGVIRVPPTRPERTGRNSSFITMASLAMPRPTIGKPPFEPSKDRHLIIGVAIGVLVTLQCIALAGALTVVLWLVTRPTPTTDDPASTTTGADIEARLDVVEERLEDAKRALDEKQANNL